MMKQLIGGVALSLAALGVANAATVSLIAPAEVAPGETFTVDIVGDFAAEAFYAGGVIVSFDPSLATLTGFEWGEDLLEVPAADGSCPGSPAPQCSDPRPDGEFFITWGTFNIFGPGLIPLGADPAVMATLTMVASASRGPADVINIDLIDAADVLAGGWFGDEFQPIAAPELFPTSVALTTTVVPLPAAAWLMIGGLGALFGFRRR